MHHILKTLETGQEIVLDMVIDRQGRAIGIDAGTYQYIQEEEGRLTKTTHSPGAYPTKKNRTSCHGSGANPDKFDGSVSFWVDD